MGWIDVETVRLLCPALADVLARREAIEGLGEVVGSTKTARRARSYWWVS